MGRISTYRSLSTGRGWKNKHGCSKTTCWSTALLGTGSIPQCWCSLREWPEGGDRGVRSQTGDWRTVGGVVDLKVCYVFIIAYHLHWCHSVKPQEAFAARHSFISLIIKTHTRQFAARRAVVRHRALMLMPLLMLPFEIVHSWISKSVTSS